MAFVVDVYAQRIVGWHASTTRTTGVVLTCLRRAVWQRQHDGHPVVPGELIHHHDAGPPDIDRHVERRQLGQQRP